ncbi:MAG: hypothetical protein HXS54_06230 [Theionarchaea archaeon]|nr:hypothetical protein [Theionarchaea archaeon]DBA34856.1 TPA_asm: hypothetical protein vir521_00062 [Caudoviricetes sp. vir521]
MDPIELSQILYVCSLIAGMLVTVYIYYEDKKAKKELLPGSFNPRYVLPAIITLVTLIPIIQAQFLAASVPIEPGSAILAGLSTGLILEAGWRIIWKAFCILTHRYTQ